MSGVWNAEDVVKRWLSNILVGLSLLMCIGVSVLWVRSYRQVRAITWVERERRGEMDEFSMVAASSWNGMMALGWNRHYNFPASKRPRPPRIQFRHFLGELGPAERVMRAGWRREFLGFGL